MRRKRVRNREGLIVVNGVHVQAMPVITETLLHLQNTGYQVLMGHTPPKKGLAKDGASLIHPELSGETAETVFSNYAQGLFTTFRIRGPHAHKKTTQVCGMPASNPFQCPRGTLLREIAEIHKSLGHDIGAEIALRTPDTTRQVREWRRVFAGTGHKPLVQWV